MTTKQLAVLLVLIFLGLPIFMVVMWKYTAFVAGVLGL